MLVGVMSVSCYSNLATPDSFLFLGLTENPLKDSNSRTLCVKSFRCPVSQLGERKESNAGRFCCGVTMKADLICNYCGKAYQKYLSLMVNGNNPYCSRRCVGLGLRKGSDLTCDNCGKTFYRSRSEQDSKLKFCSLDCRATHRTEHAKPTTYLKYGPTHRHIVIAEKYLGRPLRKGEIVHHIDEDKHNNEPDNLAVLPNQTFHNAVHAGKADCEPYRITNFLDSLVYCEMAEQKAATPTLFDLAEVEEESETDHVEDALQMVAEVAAGI